jgi:hypothetical protein
MCSIEEVRVFAVRWTHCEFHSRKGFIRINIKHPTKNVGQMYPIGNAEFIEGNLEDSEEPYIA